MISDIPKQKGSLTSQIPSIQTSFLFGEQGVPSFTLLDIAKKNSKFSALQYSLHRSSSRSKEIKRGHGQEESQENGMASKRMDYIYLECQQDQNGKCYLQFCVCGMFGYMCLCMRLLKIGMLFSNPYKATSTLIHKNLISRILNNSHDTHMGCIVTLLG